MSLITTVDVIIPSYNRSGSLLRAIDSVLKQSYQNFNLIVINDGSTDDTENKLNPYLQLPNFYYYKQINHGVSCARNLGIKNSHCEWIAFLDSDDEWMPTKLQVQVDFIQAHPHLRFVHTNEIWIRNGVRVNAKKKFEKNNQDIFRRSLETCLISPSTTLLKRELLIGHGMFDEKLPVCEDYDLWLKILASEEVGHLPDYVVKKYGGHNDQLSTKFPAMDFWRIYSMVNLLLKYDLITEHRSLVVKEIDKKAPILRAGLLKHGHLERLTELNTILDGIKKQ